MRAALCSYQGAERGNANGPQALSQTAFAEDGARDSKLLLGCFTVARDSGRRRRFYGVIALSNLSLSEMPKAARKSNRQREPFRIACAWTPRPSHLRWRRAILPHRRVPIGPDPSTPPMNPPPDHKPRHSSRALVPVPPTDGKPHMLCGPWISRFYSFVAVALHDHHRL